MAPRTPASGAAVFDCDGLLLDTEAAWTRAESSLFARHGRTFGPEDKLALIGTSFRESAGILERLLEAPGRGDEMIGELLERAAEEFAQGVAPLPGAAEAVRALRGRRPIGVASNSPRRLVELALEGAGMSESFDAVVTGDDVTHQKPAPDLYLEACRRLGRAPQETVALEDSPSGVASARAAGLYVIGVPYLPEIELEADLVAGSLTDPSVREALGL
jgi:HAD superfamily hydrolase (TIGR01509 family)